MKWKTKFIETMKRYKHAWVFLYALIYMPWFLFLEKHVTMNYHVVQTGFYFLPVVRQKESGIMAEQGSL